jgi:hypothetical protein
MLLALERKLLAAVNPSTFTPGLPVGTLTLMELYPFPRYGEIDGTAVRIEGEGNRIGFSPVTKCVELGAHGETAWIPTELVRNIRLEPTSITSRPTTTERTARRK